MTIVRDAKSGADIGFLEGGRGGGGAQHCLKVSMYSIEPHLFCYSFFFCWYV